ncbi:WS/DGAT/MGAT family O-acyltransferase [Nocardioides caldifontis]|uniref:WS/DGAT/MGAT family O-acyltransferase n=1 Tax=Nocardioides caldifontis TaxID=2588938 RepID=UPI001939FBAD|nr:wax ester/triacylglycerol synthase family O-acyltransferase [Nocardioides caldifontis]
MLGLPGRILKINDAAWLFAESRRTPMHVGMLATFSMPEDADECYLEDLVNHWRTVRTFRPPFNYVLRGPGLPRWGELTDDEIDLDYHLRHSAVPSPGGQRELGVLVSRLHTSRLDRRYPLWECHVIEGVEPGKWSLYMKVHHSQIDGVGGVRLARRMFSVDPDDRDMLPPWAVGTSGPDQSGVAHLDRKREEKLDDGFDPFAIVRSARSVVGSLAKTYAESATGLHVGDRAVPFRAPRSALNVRIQAPRRFATQIYEVDRLKRVAKAAEGSINDVFLAIVGGALRRYLDELGALPSTALTANVPVSVRPEGGAGVGNSITFLYASLGTDIADPLDRIRVVHESTRAAKDRLPEAGTTLMDTYTAVLMGPFLGQAVLGVGGLGPPDANLVVSNVPGLREPRYYNGSRLEEYYPLSLLFHGQALNITGISNADCFCIGFTGCRDSLPHLQRVAVYSGEALQELEEALGLP